MESGQLVRAPLTSNAALAPSPKIHVMATREKTECGRTVTTAWYDAPGTIDQWLARKPEAICQPCERRTKQ